MASNVSVFVAKLFGYAVTGSASMLAEAVHSAADVANQAFLAVGIYRSVREPDLEHPYGFSKERYTWALISSVGVFFLGCGFSVYHGLVVLFNPELAAGLLAAGPFSGKIGTAIFLGSIIVESAALSAAYREVRRGAHRAGVGLKEYRK